MELGESRIIIITWCTILHQGNLHVPVVRCMQPCRAGECGTSKSCLKSMHICCGKGSDQGSLSNFRMQLCHQMLNNKWLIAKRDANCTSRSVQDGNAVHQLVSCDRSHCNLRAYHSWRCECLPRPLLRLVLKKKNNSNKIIKRDLQCIFVLHLSVDV